MKFYKIAALLYHDVKVFTRVKWRLVETFYFPITTIILWGFFALYMKQFALEAGLMVLALNIFWNFAYIAQSNTNMQMMEDTWSGSLKQLFFSGISEFEYLFARIIFSTIVSVLVLVLLISISLIFGLGVIMGNVGIVSVLLFATLVSSIAMAVFIAALLISMGKEYGFLAWTLLQLFILLSAPFFAVDVFPEPMRIVSGVMPYTAIFENARNLVISGTINTDLLNKGLMISFAYLIISLPLYKLAFNRARKTGYLVKLI